MNAFVPYLAALHQQDLLQQAMLERRAKLAQGPSSVPAWRRRLSGFFASAAQSLDPSVEVERRARPVAGPAVDPLLAC